jgi:hypothetical protein
MNKNSNERTSQNKFTQGAVAPLYAMKAYRDSRDMAPLVYNVTTNGGE